LKAKISEIRISVTSHQQVAEPPHPSLELRFGAAQPQPVGDGSVGGGAAGVHHHGPAAAAHHMGAEVKHVDPLSQGRGLRQLIHPFLHREALAGEGRLIHAEVAPLDQAAIAWNAIAGGQPHPIPPHHLGHGNRHLHPIPPDGTAQLHHRQQLLHGSLGAVLLPEAQQAAHQHDHQDDQAIGGGVEPKRQQGRPQQHQDDRAGELAQQQRRRR